MKYLHQIATFFILVIFTLFFYGCSNKITQNELNRLQYEYKQLETRYDLLQAKSGITITNNISDDFVKKEEFLVLKNKYNELLKDKKQLLKEKEDTLLVKTINIKQENIYIEQNKKLQQENDELQKRIAQLDIENKAIATKNKKLQTDFEGTKKQYQKTENNISVKNTNDSTYRKEISSLNTQISALKVEISFLKEEYTKLKNQNSILVQENETLKKDIMKRKTSDTVIINNNSAKESIITNTELAKMQYDFDVLKKEYQKLENEYKALENRYLYLKASCASAAPTKPTSGIATAASAYQEVREHEFYYAALVRQLDSTQLNVELTIRNESKENQDIMLKIANIQLQTEGGGIHEPQLFAVNNQLIGSEFLKKLKRGEWATVVLSFQDMPLRGSLGSLTVNVQIGDELSRVVFDNLAVSEK